MSQFEDHINTKNIQNDLITQLNKLRQKLPEFFSKPIHVLPAVDHKVQGGLEQSLQQERKDHSGERIILIPYHLEKSHWLGILLELQTNEQIQRAECIDSVNRTNTILVQLQKQLTNVYNGVVLQRRDLIKDNDRHYSYAITIRNLLAVAANIQLSQDNNQTSTYTIASISNEGNAYRPRDLKQSLRHRIILPEDIRGSEEAKKNMKNSWIELLSSYHLSNIPNCAEKTILELLQYDNEETFLQNKDCVNATLQKLKEQMRNEELVSESNRIILQSLELALNSNDFSSMIKQLEILLQQIICLNLSEICRIVVKANEAAELIRGKDIILLVGETGVGKSTTIQFLAGATMKESSVEIASGRFLQHITAVGPVRNPQLINVISSPFSKSETRYIIPVTIQLKDILGAHETGIITLCDAPGFEDTSGPEVDIANSAEIIAALKEAKTVKLLALSSYMSLSDRGQGIQKLAHILSTMIDRIESRLDAIFYAFTKYPENIDIHAILTDIKQSTVDNDYNLKADTAFVAVLSDMIKKTRNGAHKIDPIHDNRKNLIKTLKQLRGIAYPGEVFHLPISEKTRHIIAEYLYKTKTNINCAMTHKDIELVGYYLKNLNLLNDLINESRVRQTYEESIRAINESLEQYSREVIEQFNRVLFSRDGLKEQDILDYKTSIEYLEQVQILKEYIGSSLLSPSVLIQKMITKIKEKYDSLEKDILHNDLIKIFLNNLLMLKNSFDEVKPYYSNYSKEFENRYQILIQSVDESIQTNDFKTVAEIFLQITRCLSILKNSLGDQVEENFRDKIKFFLRHLTRFSQQADRRLIEPRLSDDDIEVLKHSLEILKSAKENSFLSQCISTYLIDDIPQISKDLTEIYEEFLEKINKYFDSLTIKINERLRGGSGRAKCSFNGLIK